MNLEGIYCIPLVIRQSFFFQNDPRNLDPSYKMDLDLQDCLGRIKLVHCISAKFHRTDLAICSHSREGKLCLIPE